MTLSLSNTTCTPVPVFEILVIFAIALAGIKTSSPKRKHVGFDILRFGCFVCLTINMSEMTEISLDEDCENNLKEFVNGVDALIELAKQGTLPSECNVTMRFRTCNCETFPDMTVTQFKDVFVARSAYPETTPLTKVIYFTKKVYYSENKNTYCVHIADKYPE